MTRSEGLGAVVGRARWPVLAALASIALVLAAASGARAATCDYTWGGSTSGDWMTAGNWAGGSLPVANSNVCIASGSAVLSDTSANAPHLASLTISGTGGLTVRIHQVLVSASTTIGPNASLTLDGTYSGANAGNASLGGGPVLNQGTITMEGTGYQATLYGTVTNQGTINVPFGNVSLSVKAAMAGRARSPTKARSTSPPRRRRIPATRLRLPRSATRSPTPAARSTTKARSPSRAPMGSRVRSARATGRSPAMP